TVFISVIIRNCNKNELSPIIVSTSVCMKFLCQYIFFDKNYDILLTYLSQYILLILLIFFIFYFIVSTFLLLIFFFIFFFFRCVDFLINAASTSSDVLSEVVSILEFCAA